MSKTEPVHKLEAALFAARWFLAPFYIGLVVAVVALFGVFIVELLREVGLLFHTPPEKLTEAGILMALTLIDLSLVANLLIIVVLSGYETFISRIMTPDLERPAWMGMVDFSGMKMKLIASIVAISLISLLRTYLELSDHPPEPEALVWQLAICLVFVVSGVLLALMDLIASRTERS
jgi:uncharacterized protein (TIGR00645 family)